MVTAGASACAPGKKILRAGESPGEHSARGAARDAARGATGATGARSPHSRVGRGDYPPLARRGNRSDTPFSPLVTSVNICLIFVTGGEWVVPPSHEKARASRSARSVAPAKYPPGFRRRCDLGPPSPNHRLSHELTPQRNIND